MKYKIISYNRNEDFFRCEDENGHMYNIDLFRNYSYKGFGRLSGLKDELLDEKYDSFVGKFIEIESTFPYLVFAKNVQLLK